MSPNASRVAVVFFGTPLIARDGSHIHVDTRKAIALLAVLVGAGERQSRDELATLLWPDADTTGARGAFRRTLSVLKGALGEEAIAADRRAVMLRVDNVDVDVMRFQQVLARVRAHGHAVSNECSNCLKLLLDAISLYRGDFLAGFWLRDAPEFDDWQAAQSREYRREFAEALEGATRTLAASQNLDDAITHGRRLLELDPINEGSHRLLMQIYSVSGDRAGAIRQYRECVRVLDHELAVAPTDETTRLYEVIKEPRRAGTSPRLAPSAPPFTPSSQPLPLLGRTVETTVLRSALDRTRDRSQVVVVEGEAGVGKSRLLEDLLQHAHSNAAITLTARCYEGESDLAYAPLIQLLRASVDILRGSGKLQQLTARDLGEVARLLPELDTDTAPAIPIAGTELERAAAHTRFLEGLSRLLLAARNGGQLLIALDDLQWADLASLECIAYLARRLPPEGVGLVLVGRDDQGGRPDPLSHVVAAARRTNTLTEVGLERLDRETVVGLVEAVSLRLADRDLSSQQLGEWLYHQSEGLPLLLAEYVTVLNEGTLSESLPQGVRDLLTSRIRQVSDTAAQFLTAGAVIGRSFDFETLMVTSGRDEEMTVNALEELEAKGLVRQIPGEPGRGPYYDFSHDKLRTLVHDRTSLARRRLLHKRAAEGLLSGSGRKDESRAGQVAHHFLQAGMQSEAADFYRRAGEHYARLFATREALLHFETALTLGYPDERFLQESLGDLHLLLGEYPSAVARYEAAAAVASDLERATIERKLGEGHDRWGTPDLAETYYGEALAILGDRDPSERTRVYSGWSIAAYHRGDVQRALGLAQTAYDIAVGLGESRALGVAHNILGILKGSVDRLDEACEHLQASLNLADDVSDSGTRLAALQNFSILQRRMGDIESARRLTTEALALNGSFGDRHRDAALHNTMADLLHAQGKDEDAMRHLKEAVAIYAEIGVEAGQLRPEVWKLTEW